MSILAKKMIFLSVDFEALMKNPDQGPKHYGQGQDGKCSTKPAAADRA